MTINNKPLSLTVAHINDTHSYFDPTSLALSIAHNGHQCQPYVSAGGFARIAARVKQLKNSHTSDDFLFLHAGDCFQGTLYFSLFKGEANAVMLNALGIDAMALGNHELDMGNEPVGKFLREIDFPLLAGNWNVSGELRKQYPLKSHPNLMDFDHQTHTAKWIEKRVGEERVAIFGLSLDKMADIANPDCDTTFEPCAATAKATVDAIHKTGINKIILLSHMGYEADLALAEKVSGIGLIIGGHSHVLQGDFLALGLKSQEHYGVHINGTYVVQAGHHSMTLGHCRIDFAANGQVIGFEGRNELLVGRRAFMDVHGEHSASDIEQIKQQIHAHDHVVVVRKDPAVKAVLAEKYQPQVRALQNQTIAHVDSELRHVRLPDEYGPSQLAPLVAHSFLYTMQSLGHTVDFAMHNAGGVRNSLSVGAVSVADVAGKLLPFAVPIGMYRIKGIDIPKILEGALDNAYSNGVQGTGSGSYPYTSQLDFQYDATLPKGERVFNVRVAGEVLDENRVYTGTSSAYTMKGKEGYDAIKNMLDSGIITTWSMADCFIKMLSEQPDSVRLNSQKNAGLLP
ncbi:bifunctional metallophosphatase/5'-nucleotidase [Vibrio variabilis]|uniref:bifunctional metallophosphatase/5'-nucleotidase n=1 Tax=Vibrio variabilis TaxID=990271 RepID=UPI000DD886DF|nr:bifunctional UDP-sugar hydrolase/5'-nucleotidase [Vibrio variabilis]